MIRPKLVVVNNDRDEQSRAMRDGNGLRFELSRGRVVVYGLSLVLSLCFMFTLGVFVGRGVSVIKPGDFSFTGRFLRIFGLEKQTGAPAPKASVTWEDPKKMVASLDYYQDLTRQKRSPLGQMTQIETSPGVTVPPKEPAKAAKPAADKRPSVQPPAQQPPKPAPAAPPSGRYTLLVASLKERDARILSDKLKAHGYAPFLEPIEFGAAKWSRILLGSFPTREAAITFADQFNKKEKTEALVISGSR
ncbi:MAG: SPOR domain-containing protein [Syntrophobacteraceae bacterium]|nr:SPOR domain-containing protein [Syntrophobacteraceae bacterium]